MDQKPRKVSEKRVQFVTNTESSNQSAHNETIIKPYSGPSEITSSDAQSSYLQFPQPSPENQGHRHPMGSKFSKGAPSSIHRGADPSENMTMASGF